MDRVALKLVDAGLQLMSSRGQLSRPSPGLALIDGGDLAVGLDAECNARIKPRRLHSHFWQDLGIQPLGRPFPGHLRTADLAHAHLKHVWEKDGGRAGEVFVAAPGTYTEDQLGLFLGIAHDLEIPVVGLVDAAVAAAADRELPPKVIHLDLHLHRAVLTGLDNGDHLVRTSIHSDGRIGILRLQDIWTRTIARTFVRATRFDPLHHAATEQVLYAQLADHLEVLRTRESTVVRIASGGRQHSIEIERADIVDAALPAFAILSSLVTEHAQSGDTELLLSHRAAALPGLLEALEEGTRLGVSALHPAAAASGALAHADRIRSPGTAMRFTTRLPGLDARPPGPVTVAVNPPTDGGRQLATHLVVNGVAHAIGREPLLIGSDGIEEQPDQDRPQARVRLLAEQVVLDVTPAAEVFLNGEPVDGRATLVPGDRLRFGSARDEALVVSMAV